MFSPKPTPRRWCGRLTLLAIVLTCAVGAVLLNVIGTRGVAHVQSDIDNLASLMAGVRFLLVVGLYMAWPSLLHFCRQRHWLSPDAEEELLAKRTRMALWLLALELILGLDILNHIGALIDGLVA